MPGPNSAPNGERELVLGYSSLSVIEAGKLRAKTRLTGKTAKNDESGKNAQRERNRRATADANRRGPSADVSKGKR